MKTMRRKILFSMIVIGVMLIIIPMVASAELVSWSSEQYTAYVFQETYGGVSQTLYGPPLPISASVGAGTSKSVANISADRMYTFASVNFTDVGGVAYSSFSGAYTSLASAPLFQFNYSLLYSYSSNTPYSYPDGTYAWLTVKDSTDNSVLYSNNLLPITSILSTISVNTTPGHTISVDFGTNSWTDTYLDRNPRGTYGSQSLTLDYSTATAVAPEPISSILFVTGGTLLAGRRYIKRKKKA